MPRKILPTSACLLFAALLASAQTGGEERSLYPQTPHFVIVPKEATLANRQGPGSLLNRMEATYGAVYSLANRLEVATTRPRDPIMVSVFDDPSGFQNYANGVGFTATTDLYGFYDPDAERVVLLDFTRVGVIPEKRSEISRLVNPIRALGSTADAGESARRAAILKQGEEAFAKLDQLEEQIFCTTVQHEVAHAALSAFGVLPRTATQPAWLGEGLASQFEVPIDPLSLGTLGINELRLNDYLIAAKAGQLLPWRRLLSDDGVFKPGQPASATAYAQAWLLTHWAVKEKAKSMGDCIRALRRGGLTARERSEIFERTFDITDDRLAATLKRYADSLTSTTKPK